MSQSVVEQDQLKLKQCKIASEGGRGEGIDILYLVDTEGKIVWICRALLDCCGNRDAFDNDRCIKGRGKGETVIYRLTTTT